MNIKDEIDSIVKNAMKEISNIHHDFGETVSGNSNTKRNILEKCFQELLCEELKNSQDWDWSTEESIFTKGLTNVDKMAVDIVGIHKISLQKVLIELKYVTVVSGTNRPSDPPGFPYDVIKDCVKIELGIANNENIIYGVSIGLTNYENYWLPHKSNNWARNFHDSIQKKLITGVIKNNSAENSLEASILREGSPRCHLSLGLEWCVEWFDYSDFSNKKFKYVYVSPSIAAEINHDFNYMHDDVDYHYMPFLTKKSKDDYMEKSRKFNEKGKKKGLPT